MTVANFLDDCLPSNFWSKVQPCPISGCWLWTAATDKDGYGLFAARHGETIRRAHRLSLESFARQKIAAGLQVDHVCRTRCCVNPAHLEPVTPAENTRRGNGPAAINSRKTHCKRGHELSVDNLSPLNLTRGYRLCLKCRPEFPSAKRTREKRTTRSKPWPSH